MNTPEGVPPPTNNGSKLITWQTLAIALALLAVGAVIGYKLIPRPFRGRDEPKAKYVLVFGDGDNRVKIKSESFADFKTAIDPTHVRWRRDIKMNDPQSGPTPYPPSGDGDPGLVTISRAVITQRNKSDGSPCTMHVTQRVGLNGQDQVNAILSMLDTDYPP